MDISDFFHALSKSVDDLLGDPGQCFYIPAYQRSYAWSKDNVTQLVDDIGHGLSKLVDDSHSVTFLGTIITVNDKDYSTVAPKIRGQLPPKVMTIIDGQQRITTLLLLLAAVHDQLTVRSSQLSAHTEANEWLDQNISETYYNIAALLEDDRRTGQHQYYPRVIRAYDDQWSRNTQYLRYCSPIASFLFKYGNAKRANLSRAYSHVGDIKMKSRFTELHGLLDGIAQPASYRPTRHVVEFPNDSHLASSPSLISTLFQGDLPADVRDELNLGSSSDDFAAIFRILVFARYLLQRVAVTVVTTKSEEYAFDIFAALNTTGEPLTAIETFKPRAILAEGGQGTYSGSPSEKWMIEILSYLDQFRTAPQRQRATSDLLTPFALAEDGKKLARRLNDQRHYLMKAFERVGPELYEHRRFVRHLAMTVRVIKGKWDNKSHSSTNPAAQDLELDGIGKLCLSVLSEAKHKIVIAPLVRYYSLYRSGYLERSEVTKCLKAMTAFFCIWRGAFGGTNRIDSIYRRLMLDGEPTQGVRPFSRRPSRMNNESDFCVDFAALCRFMVYHLDKKDIGTKDDWVTQASNTAVYTASQPLTRMLLLAATHDTIPDTGSPGLIEAGSVDVLPLLTDEMWQNRALISVEHIAPINWQEPWNKGLYSDNSTLHRLGNLMLIPQGENTALSNAPWAKKRACYAIMAARSPDEADEARQKAQSEGIEIPELLKGTRAYRPLTAGVARYEEDWSVDIVRARSRRLAELAWDRLYPWLAGQEV